MRNMVAPACEIPGEECEPKLPSGVPGPRKLSFREARHPQ